MKILLLSDIHLEFKAYVPNELLVRQADVIVLAGDLHPGAAGLEWARSQFPNKEIVAIAGNHEFYHGDWDKTLDHLRHTAMHLNIHFLENESVEIRGYRFLGCTLWTDFTLHGRESQHAMIEFAKAQMFDYSVIRSAALGRNIQPTDVVRRHLESLEWLKRELPKGAPQKTIVVTHHAPHLQSAYRLAKRKPLIAPNYAANLELDVLLQAQTWLHGHLHYNNHFVFREGDRRTQIISHSRGYPVKKSSTGEMQNPDFGGGQLIDVAVSFSEDHAGNELMYA